MINRKKRHYYCMLGKPAPAEVIPALIEHAEKQGWISEHVMFCGHQPVSTLDIKQHAATPVYTIVFSKWGEIYKAPALPDMVFGNKPDDVAPVPVQPLTSSSTQGKVLTFPAPENTDAKNSK